MSNLVSLAKNGDAAAREELVKLYKPLVRSVADNFYLAGGDKDDLLQEGMLGLFSAICDYDENKGAFPSFVRLCVTRQVLSAVKSAGAAKNKPLSNYVEISRLDEKAGSYDPLEVLIEKEHCKVIRKAVSDKLTVSERRVLELFTEGFTYGDISDKLHISYKSVDGALQRAKRKLQEYKEK